MNASLTVSAAPELNVLNEETDLAASSALEAPALGGCAGASATEKPIPAAAAAEESSFASSPETEAPDPVSACPRESRTFGYARVSTRDQNLGRQIDALLEFGVKMRDIYCEKASGKDFDRPRYRSLMRRLRPGDVLVIKSIDRLGRNYEEILEEWRVIVKERGASVVVLDMPLLDTRTRSGDLTGALIADIVLQLLSYVAQVERENTRQRQAEGIAAARARGVRFGRPRKQKPACYPWVKSAYYAGRLSRRQAADRLGVSVSTFDKWMKEPTE